MRQNHLRTSRQKKAARRALALRERELRASLDETRRDRDRDTRRVLDMLKLWRGCTQPLCRRVRGCAGHLQTGPRCCADMSDIEMDWVADIFRTVDAPDADSAEAEKSYRFLPKVAAELRSLRPR